MSRRGRSVPPSAPSGDEDAAASSSKEDAQKPLQITEAQKQVFMNLLTLPQVAKKSRRRREAQSEDDESSHDPLKRILAAGKAKSNKGPEKDASPRRPVRQVQSEGEEPAKPAPAATEEPRRRPRNRKLSLAAGGGVNKPPRRPIRRSRSNVEGSTRKRKTLLAAVSKDTKTDAKELAPGGLKVPKDRVSRKRRRSKKPSAAGAAQRASSPSKREKLAAEVARRKSTLKQQMLPDLSPERNDKAVSHVRKMIEGFIEAATAKADITVEKATKKDSVTDQQIADKQQMELFNMEIAIRRLVVMAQRGDWIAFEQALKAVERQASTAYRASLEVPDGTSPARSLVVNTRPFATHPARDPATGNSLLMLAIIDNRLNLVERILDLGANINERNYENYTALHMAAMYAREDVVQFLLNHRADATLIGGPRQQTCVHLAAGRIGGGQAMQVVRELVRSSAPEVRTLPDAEGNIPLFVAIEAGNFNVCKELLTANNDEQIKRLKMPLMDTCLHLATRRRDNEMVKLFIEYGANVDAVNREGQTVLHIASLNGDENIIRNLFTARANPTIKDNDDRTAIHLAAERGHTRAVEFLADRFKASVFDRARDGSTLMHLAALHGHSETAMVLYKKGVPLLMPNRYGARGIHTAAMRGHVNVINSLVLKGENVDCVTNENYTALHLAVEAGKAVVVEALLGLGAKVHIKGGRNGETALHIASRIDEIRGEKCTRMLLKSGADPNLAMADGRTPLHVAADHGGVSSVRFLLSNGADVMAVDRDGETVLHKAAKGCHLATLKEVISFVTKALGDCTDFMQKQNSSGETALHMGCRIVKGNLHFKDEDVAIISTLMEHKSNPCMQTVTTKEAAIHYVCASGNVDILVQLIRNMQVGEIQLAINMQSSIGWSPLCVASAKGHASIVRILLEENARVDVFDHEGKSSLHLAAEFGSLPVCELLIAQNAFVNSRTKNGWTALHFASQNGHLPLIRFLVEKHDALIDAVTMKKQTPLHLAALSGNLEVCRLLLELSASMDSADETGQKPIHMAATSDKPEVMLLFLETRPSLVSSATKDGSTSAHIAAKKGSDRVIQELMKFDKTIVLGARNKITDSTPLHIATEGGHRNVVQHLLDAGASPLDENKMGFTPIHIAAKFGHTGIVEELAKHNINMRHLSRKTGMTALHVAAFFGEAEATRELLRHVPAQIKSELPSNQQYAIAKELAAEADLTPLHLASFSGGENVVRLLLNYAGVAVESPSFPSGYIPLHLACLSGHVGVVGLLLSRTTELLKHVDEQGRTCLHVAANSGHYDMVQVLIGQGADLDVTDKDGWLPTHYAAHAGFLDVVKLLVEAGSPSTAETKAGHIPLWYAAAQNNFNVVTYLLRQDHDTEDLLNDRKFVFNLMVVGKSHNHKPIEDFVFVSPAPCYTAANLSAIYRALALKEKDRAADLLEIGDICEELAKDLIGIAANVENPGIILNSLDHKNISFIDTLISNEQKIAISQFVVQQYLQEIWMGDLELSAWQLILLFCVFVVMPPVWFFFSVPIPRGYNRIPFVKFMCYLTSHLYFMAFLCLVAVFPPNDTTRDSLIPFWYEIVVWVWYFGLFLDQLTNPGNKSGLGSFRYILVVLGIGSGLVHATALFLDQYWWSFLMYIRNMFFGYSLLIAVILILDFLSFHYLFGPWAIIIGELLIDVGKFVVVMSLFITGYALLSAAMNLPFGFEDDYADDSGRSLADQIRAADEIANPLTMFELLFFALFGLNKAEDLIVSQFLQPWTIFSFKLMFASYLLLTVIVLINLLIAMMSDTYQRIQQQSDIEWKFGLAKLIRNMQRTQVAPSPLNLFTTWIVLLHSWCVRDRNERKMARKRFRQAMKDEILSKAPGMRFVADVGAEGAKMPPRVIHALGNIKWGFTDGVKPVAIDQIQSKWDHEHLYKKERAESVAKLEVFEHTSKAVNWANVIRRYLSVRGRDSELKEVNEDEHNVREMMKSLVDIRNDGAHQAARIQAVRWTKIPGEAKKQVIQKWQEKAAE